MKEVIKSVKGTRDFYPPEMAVRRWLIDKMREVSTRFGFQEYEGPCIETIDLYAAKSGDELVKEQSFVFPDRSGELLALRPELTPTLARMIANKQNELVFPLRWWSFGPFWRYERPQKGRSREFYQWNVDLIGTECIQADAEVIAVVSEFFRSVGLLPDQVKILVNNRRLMDASLDDLGITEGRKPLIHKLIDRIDKMSPQTWEQYAVDIQITPNQLKELKDILNNENMWEKSEELVNLFDTIKWLGVSDYVQFDPKIVRGLDYYTGTVFEAKEASGSFRAICGGGRYDNLVADVGGTPITGVGFAMGDVVIQLVFESLGLIPQSVSQTNSVFVTIFDEHCMSHSYKISNMLRASGFTVVVNPGVDKLNKQFKYADRLGINTVLVIGPDEIKEKTVTIKNLTEHKQFTIKENEVSEFLFSSLAGEMRL